MLNLLVRQISETLVHFYFLTQSVFFFLLLRLGNFCYCIFKFTDCFSSFPFILLSLSTEFFISFFVLSILKFQFGSSSFICWDFLLIFYLSIFYICFKNTCNYLLKYFYDSCFNSLVFWTSLVISMLASIDCFFSFKLIFLWFLV